jgi:hypothetical protein
VREESGPEDRPHWDTWDSDRPPFLRLTVRGVLGGAAFVPPLFSPTSTNTSENKKKRDRRIFNISHGFEFEFLNFFNFLTWIRIKIEVLLFCL